MDVDEVLLNSYNTLTLATLLISHMEFTLRGGHLHHITKRVGFWLKMGTGGEMPISENRREAHGLCGYRGGWREIIK